MSRLELFDAWKIKNKGMVTHTWSRGNPTIARRLDYIFVSENILPHLESSEVKSISFSDHRAVLAKFKFSDFRQGPSLFKLNTSLLKDHKYVNMIKRKIQEIRHDVSLDPHLRWESIKIEIKSTTQEYCRYKSMIKKNIHDQNIKKLNHLEERLARDPNNRNLVEQIFLVKNEIEIKVMEEAKGAQIRSKVRWIDEGEKCNKYFLSLEKANAINNTLCRVKDEYGVVVTDEKKILSVITRYYTNLYKEPKRNEDIQKHSNEFTENVEIPKLSKEDQDICESPLSLTEILQALKEMKNGSSRNRWTAC